MILLKKLRPIVFSLLLVSPLVLAREFTPNHIIGMHGGDTLAEKNPGYCTLIGQESEDEQSFTIKVSRLHDKKIKFTSSREEMQAQLEKHPKFLSFRNDNSKLLVTLIDSKFHVFTYETLDEAGKVKSEVICSMRD